MGDFLCVAVPTTNPGMLMNTLDEKLVNFVTTNNIQKNDIFVYFFSSIAILICMNLILIYFELPPFITEVIAIGLKIVLGIAVVIVWGIGLFIPYRFIRGAKVISEAATIVAIIAIAVAMAAAIAETMGGTQGAIAEAMGAQEAIPIVVAIITISIVFVIFVNIFYKKYIN